MKKRSFVSTVLAVIMAFMMVYGASPTSNAIDERILAYQAYYDFIMDVKASGGDITNLYMLDLDGNGVEELFVGGDFYDMGDKVYSNGVTHIVSSSRYDHNIYSYSNGNMFRIPNQGLEGRMYGVNGLYWSRGTDGKIYITNTPLEAEWLDMPSHDFEDKGPGIYLFNGKTFEEKMTYRIDFGWDWYVNDIFHSPYGEYFYSVNGKFVSVSEYKAALRRYYVGSSNQLVSHYNDGYAHNWSEGCDYSTWMNKIVSVAGSTHIEQYTTPSTWAATSVESAIAQAYVPKELQKKYNRPITRGEFCALAAQFYEKCKVTEIKERKYFSDTTDINVQKLGGLGVVNGVGNNQFAPNKAITRQEAATILVRLAKVMGTDLPAQAASYQDQTQIAPWALTQVGQMQKTGIMGGVGNGKFAPLEPYTREQSIVTLLRMKDALTPVSAIIVPKSEKIYRVGQTAQLSASVQPGNAGVQGITWSSLNPDIVTVDDHGKVTAVSVGTGSVKVEAENGVFAICAVTVQHTADYLDLIYTTPELNCLNIAVEGDYSGRVVSPEFGFSFVPADAKNAGTIKITSVIPTNKTIRISGIVSSVNTGFRYDFIPYLKWQLKDSGGAVVENGATVLDAGYSPVLEEGETFTVELPVSNLKDEQYTLEYIEEFGVDANEGVPSINVVGLPAEYTKSVLFDNYQSQEITTKIVSVDFKVNYSATDDGYHIGELRFNIQSKRVERYTYHHYCKVTWELKNSENEVLTGNTFKVTNSQLEDDGTDSWPSYGKKSVKLEKGKTYILEITVDY